MTTRPWLAGVAGKPVFALAIATWLAPASPASAEYVCLPRTSAGGESYLVLRTGPSVEYPEMGPMANRSVVTVMDLQDAWVYVRTSDGNTGWANRQGICLGTPDPQR